MFNDLIQTVGLPNWFYCFMEKLKKAVEMNKKL